MRIYVRTTAPEWLFGDRADVVSYTPQALDVGILQRDSLAMDLKKTLKACERFYSAAPAIIEREQSFIRDNEIKLIVGDIPPLCFEIATEAEIPSLAISNFTWDEIYRTYSTAYSGFAGIAEQVTEYYRQATLALILPYPCDMGMFPRREAIPWVARASRLTKKQARAHFALPAATKIVLLSFGGLGLERLPWDKFTSLRNFYFVATGNRQIEKGNLRILTERQDRYEDLVRAVDVIVTKPGYGIVADALAHRVPMLYTDRGEFPEYPRLVQALQDCATAEYIPQTKLLSGNLAPYLDALLSKPHNWLEVGLDGATAAAEKIIEFAHRA
jgi:L-arabinokinase